MIWTIAKKELLNNLLTFRFAVTLILSVLLITVITIVLVDEYSRNLSSYNDAFNKSWDDLSKVKVYRTLRPRVYRKPEVLSILSRGIEGRLGNEIEVSHRHVPDEASKYYGDNPLLAYFPDLDISLVFKLVLSLLALVFSYDLISGEKERGTLKLILVNQVGRHQVLLGKYVGGMISLMIPLFLSFIIGLLIIMLSSSISFSTEQWIRIFLIFLLSFLFLSIFFNLGLLLSSRTERSSVTLLLVLFSWIVLVVFIPNGGPYLATKIREVPRRTEVDNNVNAIYEVYQEKIDRYWRDRHWPEGGTQDSWDDVVQLATRNVMEYHRENASYLEPLHVERAGQAWKVRSDYVRKLINQQRLSDAVSSISPIHLYEKVISTLAGTHIETYLSFMEQAREYRNQLLAYFHKKNAFNAYAWFTVLKEEDFPEDREQTNKMRDARRKKGLTLSQITEALPSMVLDDVPGFAFRPQSLREAWAAVNLQIGALAIMHILLFLLSFVSLLRYDVT